MSYACKMQEIFEKLMMRKVTPDIKDVLMALENLHERLMVVESCVTSLEDKILNDD